MEHNVQVPEEQDRTHLMVGLLGVILVGAIGIVTITLILHIISLAL